MIDEDEAKMATRQAMNAAPDVTVAEVQEFVETALSERFRGRRLSPELGDSIAVSILSSSLDSNVLYVADGACTRCRRATRVVVIDDPDTPGGDYARTLCRECLGAATALLLRGAPEGLSKAVEEA